MNIARNYNIPIQNIYLSMITFLTVFYSFFCCPAFGLTVCGDRHQKFPEVSCAHSRAYCVCLVTLCLPRAVFWYSILIELHQLVQGMIIIVQKGILILIQVNMEQSLAIIMALEVLEEVMV